MSNISYLRDGKRFKRYLYDMRFENVYPLISEQVKEALSQYPFFVLKKVIPGDYIGQARDVEQRVREHFEEHLNIKTQNTAFAKAYRAGINFWLEKSQEISGLLTYAEAEKYELQAYVYREKLAFEKMKEEYNKTGKCTIESWNCGPYVDGSSDGAPYWDNKKGCLPLSVRWMIKYAEEHPVPQYKQVLANAKIKGE